jgi:hypothetical protein
MRSSTTAGKFGTFSALTLASAAVLVFHTAALAQQPEAKKDDATKEAAPSAKDAKVKKAPASAAKAKKAAEPAPEAKAEPAPEADAKAAPKAEAEAKVAATPEAEAKAPQAPPQATEELPPEYSPPPGYRHGPPPPPPPPRYPQPPSEGYYGPYYHDYYYGAPPPPYPPPRYYRRYAPPPPVRYYPEPLRYRTFFFGFGLGVGGVGVFPNQTGASNASRVGLGYSFRFGFGVSPRWSIVLAADGASAYFDNISVTETVFTVGPQVFITRNLYARAGIGAAGRVYDYGDYYDQGYYYNDSERESGMGAAGAVGFEFMQSYHVALALEALATIGYYPNHDVLSTFGVNFALSLF